MESLASECVAIDLQALGKLHHASFCHHTKVMEQDMIEQALSRGLDGIMALTPHMFIGNGMLLGWHLGREYERRMSMERMFGCDVKPAKQRATRKRKVD